ncbi:hypothetical protein H257_14716 [Aphanomyces astaci]|uniref:Peptidase M14 domain-containing protein n=1 Tax=Aphanomyces astaci TaxID=112090 RepID=W4FQ34_APHAT|nr:hypothetical protein H257_14716 [Aphanomyces astaci]ETV69582.1 hypothetical protein H257_14716 [Aphanomyces astaci]|eukprot:XP_009840909.1 hypothetical protein H257_14716 [Aphanomyces astaci]
MKFFLLSAIALFASATTAQTNNTFTVFDDRARTLIEEDEFLLFFQNAKVNRACHEQNANYISSLKAGQYSTSAFYNCFRTLDQINEFIDTLVAQNSNLVSKFAISKTYKGATIYGYKLTKGHSKSLYFQALQHAREWVAGSSILFSFSSILDDIANKKPTAADEYDLYFVPVVNIDGYEMSWKDGYRSKRTNANEVDLNRNWPTPFENPNPPVKGDGTYPGLKPFSEPEAAGINEWLLSKRDEIQGFLDIHAWGGLILYPYGDNNQTIGGGFDEKFQDLGRGLKNAMGEYAPGPSYTLYASYGLFKDYAFREFKKAAVTIEVIGDTYIAKASTIPTRGLEVYKGINQFAKEVTVFNGEDVTPNKPSHGD